MSQSRRLPTVAGLGLTAMLWSGLSPIAAQAAASHYASPNGSGASCTQSDPCAVQTAIASAASDDFVYLLANQGVYQLTGNLTNLPNTPIRLRSAAGRAQLWFTNGQLNLTGGDVDGLSVHGDSSHAAFMLTDAVGSRMIAQAGSGQAACSVSNVTLIDSVCTAIANSGTLAIETTGDNKLRNDTFVGGTQAAVVGAAIQSACGCSSTTDTLVNVIARAAAGGKDIVAESDGTIPATVKVSYSNFATSETTGPGQGATLATIKTNSTNQSAAPVFQTATPGDTHEAPSSPTIDAGKDDPANGVYDIDFNARIMGTRTDIGADEFISPPDTAIISSTITRDKHRATFTFKSLGPSTSFECELTARRSGTAPAFTACTSPKTYRHLTSGRWRFRVRAIGAGGTDASPAHESFRI